MGTKKSLLRRATAFALAFVMAFSMLFTGNTAITANAAATATKIKVAKKSISIEPGKTAKVKVTVTGSNKKFTAKSSNKKVATVKVVGKNVVIKAKNKLGKTAKITVTTKGKNNKGKKLSAKITVKVAKAEPTTEATTAATTAATTTEDATAKKAEADKAAATPVATAISALPAATAVTTADEATITSARKAYDALTADQKALVRDVLKKLTDAEAALAEAKKPAPIVAVKSVKVKLGVESVLAGKTTTATATIEPSDATNKTVTWSSTDTKVATIDASTGVITAIAEGTTVIKATSADESAVSGEARLTVASAANIKLSKSSATLIKDETVQLTTSVLIPSDSKITYSSSDTSIADVNASTGLVTAKSEGKAVITATTDYNVSASCEITVANDDTVLVNSFKLEKADGTFTVGVSMKGTDKTVTDAQLSGSKLSITNVETGKVIEATYVDGSLNQGVATYAFDSSLITSGSYSLNTTGNANIAIDVQDDDGLTESVTVTELSTGVVGYVLQKTNNDPIANATVVVYAGGEKIDTTQTDAKGRFELELSENSNYTIEASREGYFTTSMDNTVVTMNKVTTCNMRMDDINEEEFAIIGQASVSDADTKDLDDVAKPIAVLYALDAGTPVVIASTTVSSAGWFAFANSDETITYSDDYVLNDGNYKFEYWNTYIFNSKAGLSMDKTYQVVVYKTLRSEEATGEDYYDGINASNNTAVYKKAVLASDLALSTYNKVTEIEDTMELAEVPVFEGLNVAAGEIKWTDPDHKPSTDKVKIDYVVYSKETSHRIIVAKANDIEVELNAAKDASKDAVDLIKADEKLTLPAGKYDVVIKTAGYANVRKEIVIDDAGNVTAATKLKDINFTPAVNYALILLLEKGKFYDEDNENLHVGDKVTLMDLLGNKLANEAYLNLKVYEVSGGKELIVDNINIVDKERFFKVEDATDGLTKISTNVPIKGLIDGNKYRIYFDSPVLSLSDDNESTLKNNGYLEFTYSSKNPTNPIIPLFKAQANIQTIKIASIDQFEHVDVTAPLKVNSVKLIKKDGENETEIKKVEVNRYYSCGNKASLNEADKRLVDTGDNPVSGGGDLKTGGISVGFGNIDDGKYLIKISVNGYEELTVPLDAGIDLIGLQEGVYTVDVPDDSFKKVPEITISGNIKYNKNKVESRVDIVVLNSKGKIAGVGTTNNGEYSIVNGNNAVLKENESYTLVFRSAEYGTLTVTTKEALNRGVNKQDDVVLTRGTAKIKATIYEEGTDDGLSSASVIVVDNKYLESIDDNFADADTVNAVKDAYENLQYIGAFYMGQDANNKAFWEVKNVPLATEYTIMAGGAKYEPTTKVAGALKTSGTTLTVNDMTVPLAVNAKTTPVSISVLRNAILPFDGYSNYDVVYVYSVDALNNESFVTSELKARSNDTFADIKLPAGNYKVYVYSKGYYVGSQTITVSKNATGTQEEVVSLQAAVD